MQLASNDSHIHAKLYVLLCTSLLIHVRVWFVLFVSSLIRRRSFFSHPIYLCSSSLLSVLRRQSFRVANVQTVASMHFDVVFFRLFCSLHTTTDSVTCYCLAQDTFHDQIKTNELVRHGKPMQCINVLDGSAQTFHIHIKYGPLFFFVHFTFFLLFVCWPSIDPFVANKIFKTFNNNCTQSYFLFPLCKRYNELFINDFMNASVADTN